METLNLIQHRLETLSPGEIFTTRQMLRFGHRRKVDQILYRLVKDGRIRRLSYGVFCRNKENDMVSPTVQDVTLIKVRGNKVKIADKFPLNQSVDDTQNFIFFTEDYSGTFLFLGQKVVLKKICGRKYKLSQSEIGRALLRLWLSGRRNVDSDEVRIVIETLSTNDKAKLRSYLPWIPGWLHNYLIDEINQLGL